MGRPRKDLTDEQVEQVEKLAAVLSQDQIADFLGVSDRTLRRRIQDDENVKAAYEKGRAKAILGVATGLLQMARDGNVTAAIFYLKTQAGWKEPRQDREPGAMDATDAARMICSAVQEATERTGIANE